MAWQQRCVLAGFFMCSHGVCSSSWMASLSPRSHRKDASLSWGRLLPAPVSAGWRCAAGCRVCTRAGIHDPAMPLCRSAHHECAGKQALWRLCCCCCQPPAYRRSLPGMLCAVPKPGREPSGSMHPLTLCRPHAVRSVLHAVPAVQMPEHGRDPDEIMHLLNDWTDMQLEGFFK